MTFHVKPNTEHYIRNKRGDPLNLTSCIMNISKILLRTLIQMEMEQIEMLKIEMKEHPITAKYDQISIHKCEGRIEAFNTILNLKKA